MDKPSSVSPVAEKASLSKDNQGNIEKELRNEDSMSNETSRPEDFLSKDCGDGSVKGGANATNVVLSDTMEYTLSSSSTGSTKAKAARERNSTRSSRSSMIRAKSYGDLLTGTNGILSGRKKEILMNLIMRLRFEEKHGKQQAGRDFTGPLQLNQFLREFCLYFIYMTTGPFSLLVLMPILGKKIAKAKLFLPNSLFMGPYLRMLATAMCFPLVIFHLLLTTGTLSRHIFWSDLFLPSILVLNYCILNALKYGYQDPVNYRARNVRSKENNSKVERSGTQSFRIRSAFSNHRPKLGRSEMAKKQHELKKLSESPAVAVLLFSGMVGNSYDRQRVATREVEWAATNILNMESDFIIIPTGLYQSQSVAGRMSVVQNARSLTHRVDLLNREKHRGSNKDMARKKSISTIAIAHAITSAAIHESDDKTAWQPTAQKNISLHQKVVTAVRVWVFVYFCARVYVMHAECEGKFNTIPWSAYLVILVCTMAPFSGGQFWAIHAATPFSDFRRRYYLESKLSMLIHQMDVYSTADVDAWRRLRLCLQEMGSPYYLGINYYNAYTVLSCMLYMFFLGFFTILDVHQKPSKVSQNYICIPLVYFCLMVQFLVLLGIRQGSKVNRVAIDHVNEWIKVQQRLNRALNDERDELDQALHDIVMFEHRKASGVPQQVDDDESSIALEDEVEGNDESSIPVGGEIESINERVKALKLSIRKLKSAKDSAHLLCEELQLAITFRGLRMFSMRLSKILFKSLFLVFLYEVYYVTLYYILDGDMSNIYSI